MEPAEAAAVVVRGPPRWVAPIALSKIRKTAPPANLIELLETVTAAAPIGAPGAAIGIGSGAGASTVVRPVVPRTAKPRAPKTATGALAEVAEAEVAPGATEAAEAAGTVAAAPAAEAPEAAIPIAALPPALEALKTRLETVEGRDKTLVHPEAFVPSNRKAFKNFIIQTYRRYRLPPVPEIPDPDACAKQASSKEVKSFAYQSFVRDYIQRPSPYRGVLTYHGLGSGKTCTSIAAMEVLQQADRTKPVFVLTPASLNPNYRDEITKCGPFIFRTSNFWTFVPVPRLKDRTPEAQLLLNFGIPPFSIQKRKGAWLPDPSKAANYDLLAPEQKKQIQEQIYELMDNRFTFINYNGLQEKTVRDWACNTPHKFDGATMVVDEIHNLIRTINNSELDAFYREEPRDLAEYMPKFCEVGQKYRISYLLYRMLCNAVGLKLIALSDTPIINFPQEVAILANLLSGDTRMIEASTPGLDRRVALEKALQAHPEVDFAEVIARAETGTSFVRVTPVPSGYRKVVDPATGSFRG